jgi:hypothetical protein
MAETSFNEGFKIPFRNYIIADLPVNALIGERFLGGWLATFYNDSTTFPLATFSPMSGTPSNLNIIQKFHIMINCYSNQHYDEAWSIDKAILDLCGGPSGPAYVNSNITIRPASTGDEIFDEAARLYGVSRRYLVVYITW